MKNDLPIVWAILALCWITMLGSCTPAKTLRMLVDDEYWVQQPSWSPSGEYDPNINDGVLHYDIWDVPR